MNALLAIPAVALTLLALGCAGAPTPKPLEIRSLAHGGNSGIQVARQEVISDARRWEEIWNEHRGKSSAPLPKVDFTKELVVVATMGRQNTGGFSIRVVGAEVVKDKLRIEIARTVPAPGSMAIQVLTSPYDFVAIPRVKGSPEFVDAPPKTGK